MRPRRALVTGASTGLGAALARQLATGRTDLVLTARDERRLQDLADELRSLYGVEVTVIPADLTANSGLDTLANFLRYAEPPVEMLVNNAGFGVYEPFDESDIHDERRMHELLSWAPLRLTHAVLPGMLERGRGWILNVASAAAFIPSGTYGAAKLATVAHSRSLNAQYRARGVRVTALCPGLLATEFHDRMGADHLPKLPRLAWANTSRVAREGLRACLRGAPVCTSDWRYRLLRPLMAVLPDRLLIRLQ